MKTQIMVVTDIQTPFESLDDAVIHISALDKSSYPVGLKFQDGHVKWFVTDINFDEFVTDSPIFKKLRDSAKMWQSIEKRSQSYVFNDQTAVSI
jgi:hypothetical protein